MTNMAAFLRLLFVLSPTLLLLTTPINAQQGSLFTLCMNDTGFYTPKSTYDTNLHGVLSSLTTNIVNGFTSSSFGENPNRVYAIGFCRGDLKPDECKSCLNDSKSSLTQRCPKHKAAVGWYRTCTLRYSSRYLYGIMDRDTAFYSRSLQNVSSDIDSFSQEVRALMESLTLTVVNGREGGSSRNFAAGNVTATHKVGVAYAMVQCTPDLSAIDCNDCIYRGLEIIADYCYGMTYAYAGLPSCNAAYNTTRFYDSTIDSLILLPPPPPSSSPGGVPPPLPSTNGSGRKNNTSRTVTIAVVSSVIAIILLPICIWFYLWKRKIKKEKFQTSNSSEDLEEVTSEEFSQFNFVKIRDATNDFSKENKLGQGGFGVVYRGRLPNGQEIAVKRQIGHRNSPGQGDLDFKNEVLLVAKLGHRNLVKLLGFCLEKNERILVYEFMPNSSLDRFIFDPIRREHLDWDRRYKIIKGIARGLLYLHEESHLKIIHRDLKASNILLDAEMNPKISDFGTAKLFPLDQSLQNTKLIVGTYGYMAPEYIQRGEFSVKSDVFSFGVLVLEIVSGQKVKDFHEGEKVENLLSYAWKNWMEGKASSLADPKMRGGSRHEILRCIHIGLLCVQEKVAHRPTMGSVDLMLSSSSVSFRPPSRPAYFTEWSCESRLTELNQSQISNSDKNSENYVSITELYPR